MAPDEASADKHENPDVVVEAYATDPFAAAAWTALGARGEVGEFTHAALPGGGEDVTVTTANGTAFTIRVGPNPAPPLGAREFRAVYAAGTTDIGWYWGDEATDSVTLLAATPQPGPASRLAGAPTVPYSAAAWADIDLEYREGLPAAEAE